MLYNVVLVSAVQGVESVICIRISPPSFTSRPAHDGGGRDINHTITSLSSSSGAWG